MGNNELLRWVLRGKYPHEIVQTSLIKFRKYRMSQNKIHKIIIKK